jgi:hypothetical protein
MIHDPFSYRFLSMLFRPLLWQRKAGFLMTDHASLFTETGLTTNIRNDTSDLKGLISRNDLELKGMTL